MAKPKYKIGDSVRTRHSPPANPDDWPCWNPSMSPFCGKEGRISQIYLSRTLESIGYYINHIDGTQFIWHENWLEPGEPKKPYEDIINKSKELETKFLNRKG